MMILICEKKIKKSKDARARAEGQSKLVIRGLQVVVQTNSNDYNKKIAINTEFNGYVAVGLLIKGLETANYL